MSKLIEVALHGVIVKEDEQNCAFDKFTSLLAQVAFDSENILFLF